MKTLCKISAICLLSLTLGAAAKAPKQVDMLIINAHVLTMDSERTAYTRGVIAVRDTKIIAVGGSDLTDRYQSDTIIDAGGDIAMPGMINLHNHIPMVAFRGLGENGIKNRLHRFFFPLEKKMLSRSLIRVSARHAAIEAAMSGVTLITDMYYHEDEVAHSVAEVGLRGVLGETVIGFPVIDAPTPYGGYDYAKKFIKEWKSHPLITPAIAPHAPYTVSPEWLMKSKALAEQEGVPILIHLAEVELEASRSKKVGHTIPEGQSIIQYLDDLGFLSDSVVAAHVIFANENDISILHRNNVGVGHNPKANSLSAKVTVEGPGGLSPAWDMYKAGLDIGLGTDGPLSSNQMDIIDIMSYTALVARLRSGDSTQFTPYELVYMATMGGAKALDMEEQIGSLEVGKKADIILVDVHAPNMQPLYDPYATLAFAAYPQDVHTTIVNGVIVVKDGVITTIDMSAHQKEWELIMQSVAEFAKTLDYTGSIQ